MNNPPPPPEGEHEKSINEENDAPIDSIWRFVVCSDQRNTAQTVAELEQFLTSISNGPTSYYPTPDVAWLRCAPLNQSELSSSITGLPESDDIWLSIELSSKEDIVSDQRYSVRWIDTRIAPPSLTTRQEVVLFLRSIFETNRDDDDWINRNSPWFAPQNDSQRLLECILLVVPRQPSELLSSFSIGDIFPAYALYSSVDVVLPSPISDDTDAHLLVYRRLPSRRYLSDLHPMTQEPVPMRGCLWETVYTKHLEEEEDETADGESSNTARQPEPTISYRIVGPPYMDLSELDPQLHSLPKLLQPEVRVILQQEVARIADFFIAWPEPQHYEDSGTSWNVFPLCHCFPGDNISQRRWIPRTCAYVPQTVALLKDCFAPSTDGTAPHWLLRTALYSRLAPDAVLQAHTGWADLANSVLRLHIPIELPDEPRLCGTWVDGCVRFHEYGRLLLWDDSKIHRAYNYSSTQSRTVLILDVVRPDHWPPGTATGGHSEELDAFIRQFQEVADAPGR